MSTVLTFVCDGCGQEHRHIPPYRLALTGHAGDKHFDSVECGKRFIEKEFEKQAQAEKVFGQKAP